MQKIMQKKLKQNKKSKLPLIKRMKKLFKNLIKMNQKRRT